MPDHVFTVEANWQGRGVYFQCSCSSRRWYRYPSITLDELTEFADEHIRGAEVWEGVEPDSGNHRRCPAVKAASSTAPWLRGLNCIWPPDHEDNPQGTTGLRPDTRVHRDSSGILWFEPAEGYVTKSTLTSEDTMVDIETGPVVVCTCSGPATGLGHSRWCPACSS